MAKNVKEKYTGPKVTDTNTFIQKARWVHGDKYDYSEVEYKTAVRKIEIICNLHGSFYQTPASHNTGCGCPRCGFESTSEQLMKDTDWFIEEARKIHGNEYDYTNSVYKGACVKIEITCKDHGPFWQTPPSHLYQKCGCPVCRYLKSGASNRKDTRDFIKRAKLIHGNYYDYSFSDYIKNDTPLKIICPKHGEFQQWPIHHLRGSGCAKCGEIKSRESRTKDTRWFIEKSKERHGDMYGYSNVDYKGSAQKVEILCRKHGSFWQSPVSHYFRGSGCPVCAEESAGENWNPNSAYGLMGYYGTSYNSNLYVFNINSVCIKVGLAKDIPYRMNTINKESGYSVEKIYSISGKANELFELEQKILRKSNLKRFYPEVSFGGQSECLELSELPKVLQIIEDWVDSQSKECHTEDSQTEKEI